MMKFLPSILALLVAAAGALAPQIQSLVMAHPALSMVLAALYSILCHAMPPPGALPKKEGE